MKDADGRSVSNSFVFPAGSWRAAPGALLLLRAFSGIGLTAAVRYDLVSEFYPFQSGTSLALGLALALEAASK